jgi:two-component system, NtrC family, response regulator HydG
MINKGYFVEKNSQKPIDPKTTGLLLDAMADGVFVLDNEGKISLWNRAMESISGYLAEEAIGKSCMILGFNHCFEKACPSGFAKCGIFKHGAVDSKNCQLRHKNGHDVPVLKSARVVLDDNGNVRGVVETVTNLTELQNTRQKAEDAARRLGEIHRLDNIIGKSNPMQLVFSAIKAAASSDATILIQGESGTGKELVAGAIHYNSQRAAMHLVTVNCSALSESLLESELFGHAKGAFTGALRDRVGRFEDASGGTIFLDEIGDISPLIQVKLLRVLQEREIERVGESKKRKIDIRIIAATNRDLYQLVREGNFREDLYYRLKVFPIPVPPLNTRKKDIPLLADHFIQTQNRKTGKQILGISHAAMQLLMDHSWPGNVRELENAIEHAFVLCNGDEIDTFDLPVEIRQTGYWQTTARTNTGPRFPTFSRIKLTSESLWELLEQCNWNKAEVGRRVGLSRTAIWKYMKKWDIPLQRP